MAAGGAGVARADGMVVFVPGAVEGDTLRVVINKRKKDYAEARIIEILSPSPVRKASPCPHAGICGGCQWQHIEYEAQLRFKHSIVKDALERIAGLRGVAVKEVKASGLVFHYRNKMEFSFSERVWVPSALEAKSDGPSGVFLGLHVPGTYYKVIDIERCLLIPDEGSAVVCRVRELCRKTGIPAYGLKSHVGLWRFLTLRYSRSSSRWLVNLITSGQGQAPLDVIAGDLTARFPSVSTVVHTINRRKAAIAAGDEERIIEGEGFLLDKIGPWTFRISASSFFQTNTEAASCLYDEVLRLAELSGSEHVLDLYSGTGTIPIYISSRAKRVIGMELSEKAVMDARVNCDANGVFNCRFVCGDIRLLLKDLPERPDVVIMDPPRSGMHKEVVASLLRLSPSRMIYVSCNPATMARDLALLSQDYAVGEVQPVDMFPHTHHVECVARLDRRKPMA
jgi:23S rRNA (uracil1939-C5)-methyltransferase